MDYFYRAYDTDGRLRVGQIQAHSNEEAFFALSEQKLIVVELKEGKRTLWARLNEPRGSAYSIGRRDVHRLLADLSQLFSSGIRVESALRIASELATKLSVKKLALALLNDLRKGLTLAEACNNQRGIFPPHITAAVGAGERSGQLGQALARLTSSEAQILGFQEKLASNLIYPVLLLLTVSVTFAVIIFVVLPGFAPLFDLNDSRVPLVTRLVMRIGANASSIATFIAIVIASALALFAYTISNPEAKASFDRWIIHQNVGREWIAAPDLIRATQILGSSLESGVKIDVSLRLAIGSTHNTFLRKIFLEGMHEVRRGQSLADFWEKQPAIPPLLVHFLRIGEQTGDLGSMCMIAAQQLTNSYQKRLDRLLALFPPLITLVLGVVAAVLVSAVLLGMISLNNVAI